jgi:hypothetical protein
MIVKPKAAEIALSTANTVDEASCVRIYNDSGADVLITNTSTSGTFTLPNGAITFVQKLPTDTLTAGSAVKAVSVAFNIS